jgi:hypothetical protein
MPSISTLCGILSQPSVFLFFRELFHFLTRNGSMKDLNSMSTFLTSHYKHYYPHLLVTGRPWFWQRSQNWSSINLYSGFIHCVRQGVCIDISSYFDCIPKRTAIPRFNSFLYILESRFLTIILKERKNLKFIRLVPYLDWLCLSPSVFLETNLRTH